MNRWRTAIATVMTGAAALFIATVFRLDEPLPARLNITHRSQLVPAVVNLPELPHTLTLFAPVQQDGAVSPRLPQLVSVTQEGPQLAVAAYADIGESWLVTFRTASGQFRRATIGQKINGTGYRLQSFRLATAESHKQLPIALLRDAGGQVWEIGQITQPASLICQLRTPDGSMQDLHIGEAFRLDSSEWRLISATAHPPSAIFANEKGDETRLTPTTVGSSSPSSTVLPNAAASAASIH